MRSRVVLLLAAIFVGACTGDEGGGTRGGAEEGAGISFGAPGLAAVELLGPSTEGASEVPTFEWSPVEGAAAYRLVVVGPDGGAVWAWEGDATSVALGGVPDRPVGAEGPVLSPGSSWSVSALDTEGHVMAVSVLRPVSP